MKATLALLAAAVLLSPALAAAQEPEPKKAIEVSFTKARIADKEGRLQEAVKLYAYLVRKWPEDPRFTPMAYLYGASCYARLGDMRKAKEVVRDLLAAFPKRDDMRNYSDQLLAEIRAVEAKKAEEEARSRRAADEAEDLRRRNEELERVWKEQGVSKDVIEKRIAQAKKEYEAALERRRLLDEAERKFREMDLVEEEYRKRIAEMERRMAEMEERRFRETHDRGMDVAREEFLRDAKRLGIPPEEAEALLEKHRRRGPERHFEVPEELVDRLRHHEKILEEMGRRLERLEEHLEEITVVLKKALEHGREKMAKIERRMKALESGKAKKTVE